MSEIAIRIENLGKKFLIGHQVDGNLRGSLVNKFNQLIGSSKERVVEEFWALKDISFDVKKGDTVGIIGRNGAGKSTLLKILSRITDPSTGRFEINGRVSSLLEVGTGFHSELTGRENIYLNGTILGMRRSEIKLKFDAIVEFSGVEKFIDTPVKHYSSGMKVRLAFSVAAHLEPEILIVDEVLAVGDAEFQKKCLGKMDEVSRTEGRTVLFVSHNLGAVSRLCSFGVYLDKGKILFSGAMDEAIDLYSSKRKDSKTDFAHDIVKKIVLSTKNNNILIELTFANFPVGRTPFLGFVLTGLDGTPVFGTNPKISGKQEDIKYFERGKISAMVSQPKLHSGTYGLSVYFGDGKEDLFVSQDEMLVTIDNDNIINVKPDVRKVGPIIPNVQWEVFDDE